MGGLEHRSSRCKGPGAGPSWRLSQGCLAPPPGSPSWFSLQADRVFLLGLEASPYASAHPPDPDCPQLVGQEPLRHKQDPYRQEWGLACSLPTVWDWSPSPGGEGSSVLCVPSRSFHAWAQEGPCSGRPSQITPATPYLRPPVPPSPQAGHAVGRDLTPFLSCQGP